MEFKLRVTRRRVTVLVALLTITAAGVAYATIPGSGGVISGCRDGKTGVLRVIDAEAGQACTAKEIALNWNQTGPQGPQGPQGTPGTAEAYARITAGGTANPDFSRGVTDANVSHPGTGIYCLRSLSFQPRVAIANGVAALRTDGAGTLLPAQEDTVITTSTLDPSTGNFLAFCDTATTPEAERASVRIYVYQVGVGLVDRNFSILLDN